MPTRDTRQSEPDNLHLPDELAERLSAMHDRRVFVPPDVDRAVLDAAEEHFGQERAVTRRLWLRFAGPIAAAAMIGLGVWVTWPGSGPKTVRPMPVVRGDADQNGTVDILDAFAIARVIDAGQSAPPGWDFNADGKIDHDDVTVVAGLAVSVSGDGDDEPFRGRGASS